MLVNIRLYVEFWNSLLLNKAMPKTSDLNKVKKSALPKIAFSRLSVQDVASVYHMPMVTLVSKAHAVHCRYFDPQQIQTSQLLSIKTGGCSENCAYCPQSAHYNTGVNKEKLMDLSSVLSAARSAKKQGATRFCMGAAWREVRDGPLFDRVLDMVSAVKDLELEVCCTLGMLSEEQAVRLKKAGLYAYNHNIDTSKNFYPKIITTRKYEDRLRTIQSVRKAGITVCTGGIVGMGETKQDRIEFLHQLAILQPSPESVTINKLIPIPGTPLARQKPLPHLEIIRVIATARILMPQSMVRLSAGRTGMSESDQFLCFFAGANSIFIGEKLLTSANPGLSKDTEMLQRLGMSVRTC